MLYAISPYTNAHRVITTREEAPPYWRIQPAWEDGFLHWHGGDRCPLPEDTLYDARMEDGTTVSGAITTSMDNWSFVTAYRPRLGDDPMRDFEVVPVGTQALHRKIERLLESLRSGDITVAQFMDVKDGLYREQAEEDAS